MGSRSHTCSLKSSHTKLTLMLLWFIVEFCVMVLFKIDAMSQNCHVLTTVCWEFSKELFDLELYSGLLICYFCIIMIVWLDSRFYFSCNMIIIKLFFNCSVPELQFNSNLIKKKDFKVIFHKFIIRQIDISGLLYNLNL